MKAGIAFARAASHPSASGVRSVFPKAIAIAASCRVRTGEQAQFSPVILCVEALNALPA